MRTQQQTNPSPNRLAEDTIETGRAADTHRGIVLVAKLPDLVWVPAVTAGLIFLIGWLGWSIGQPWLFASLGPTAYLLAHSPSQPSARAYNLIAGHLIGLSVAFAAVVILGANEAPSVFTTHQLSGLRVLASGLALVLAVSIELLFNASHPPAASTVLLITLGAFPPTFSNAGYILIGVALLALLGEPLRRIRISV